MLCEGQALVLFACLFASGHALTPPTSKRHISPQSSASTHTLSRRTYLTTTASAVLFISTATPRPVGAANVKITSYPPLEFLEPIYELKLSVESLASGVTDPKRWPMIKRRLDQFFLGGPFSEKMYYSVLSSQYSKQIQYGDEPSESVNSDRRERREAMDATLASIEALKNNLGEKEVDAEALLANAEAAKVSIAGWFAMLPEEDLKEVERLFLAVRRADADRDGILSDSELATLPASDRDVWKRRVDLVGE